MNFTVDLTLVLERLFWIVFRQGVKDITMENVQDAIEAYGVPVRTQVHEAIRSYVDELQSTPIPLSPDKAHHRMKLLIVGHRSVAKGGSSAWARLLSFLS